jgi:hypothetical protein
MQHGSTFVFRAKIHPLVWKIPVAFPLIRPIMIQEEVNGRSTPGTIIFEINKIIMKLTS